MEINLDFKKWLVSEVGGATGAVFDPFQKSRDWNWEGAPGSIGVSPKEGPIGAKKCKKCKKENFEEGILGKWGRGAVAGAALLGGAMGMNSDATAADNIPSSSYTSPDAKQFSGGDQNYHWNGEIGKYQVQKDSKGRTVYVSKKGNFLRVPSNIDPSGFKFVRVNL